MNRTRLAVALPLAGLLAASACASEAEDATLEGTTVEAPADTGEGAGMVTGTTGAPGPGTAGTPGTPPAPLPDTIQ